MIFMCSGTTAEKEIVLEYRDLTGGKDETDADTRPTTTVIQLQNTIILKLNYRMGINFFLFLFSILKLIHYTNRS